MNMKHTRRKTLCADLTGGGEAYFFINNLREGIRANQVGRLFRDPRELA